ncbi:hypothetical protein IFM89_025090, partial [Coptis chinensis]
CSFLIFNILLLCKSKRVGGRSDGVQARTLSLVFILSCNFVGAQVAVALEETSLCSDHSADLNTATHMDQLRDELEMDPKLPAVLLMGGGEGMGPVKKTAKALGDALFNESMGHPIGQVVVICGRNKSLSSILIALYMLQW